MRTFGLTLLVLYSGLLVLGAWPAEVRPAALDALGRTPSTLLRAVGIRPGIAVFEAGRERTTRVVRNDCIRARGHPAGAPAVLVAPPDGHCHTRGFRWRLPWQEALLRSLLLRTRAPEAVLGDWLCGADRSRTDPFERVDVLWTQPWVDLETGEEGVAHAAWFAWRCDPPGLEKRLLRPSEAELRRLGVLP